ncbi:MAG: RDD family protein [Chloroflexi bacterium]|nr:RDD family protein [Chloroflexota bacterium]
MGEANEQFDEGHERASPSLRIAALAIDWWIGVLTLTVVSLAAIDTAPVNAISMRSWQERLDDLWFADFALAVYWGGLVTLVFRFLVSLLFGTTPGRKLTGLLIGANAGGRPASRGLIALRDLIVLLLFAIPVLNAAWIVLVLRDSKKPGWRERLSGAAVTQRSRAPRNIDSGLPDSRPLPWRDARRPFATPESPAAEATKRTDSGRERAGLGLRIGALAIDAWVVLTAVSLWGALLFSPEVSQPVDPTLMRNLLRTLAVVSLYVMVIHILAFRFLMSLLFRTTPGRKITGLRVVTDLGGFPVSRARLAFREFLAGLFFSLPVVNIFWLALIVRHSRSPGWHEEASKTTVVRAT